MQGKAELKYNRRSASKVRQVLNLIRGKGIAEAEQILKYCQRGASEEVTKLLQSATANAEFLHSLTSDQLYVKEAYANEAPTIKRIRPRARGRADRIFKRNSHVTIVVESIAALEEISGSAKGSAKKAAGKATTSESDARAKRIAASKKADEKSEKADKAKTDKSEKKTQAKAEKSAEDKPKAKSTTAKSSTKKETAQKATSKDSTEESSTKEKGEK